jgi:hypothetical protein
MKEGKLVGRRLGPREGAARSLAIAAMAVMGAARANRRF